MDKMQIYNATKECPKNALKEIKAGRLKGKSDINPMWRIKTLTEQFGACGVGWYYDITRQWTEHGASGEIAAFCNIDLFIKVDGEWSKPIKGTGGSSFIAQEKGGLYLSDECYKMALTDAISVACKALGFAADVYWNADRTKYDQPQTPVKTEQSTSDDVKSEVPKINQTTVDIIESFIVKTNSDKAGLLKYYRVDDVRDMSQEQARHCLGILQQKMKDIGNG